MNLLKPKQLAAYFSGYFVAKLSPAHKFSFTVWEKNRITCDFETEEGGNQTINIIIPLKENAPYRFVCPTGHEQLCNLQRLKFLLWEWLQDCTD